MALLLPHTSLLSSAGSYFLGTSEEPRSSRNRLCARESRTAAALVLIEKYTPSACVSSPSQALSSTISRSSSSSAIIASRTLVSAMTASSAELSFLGGCSVDSKADRRFLDRRALRRTLRATPNIQGSSASWGTLSRRRQTTIIVSSTKSSRSDEVRG